tara:strand:- start:686 stop:832 length:147 start_codon:yes stop_codon:yes gene_type:complete
MSKKRRRVEWLWDDDEWYLGTVIEATQGVSVSYDDKTNNIRVQSALKI